MDAKLIADKLHDLSTKFTELQEMIDEIRVLAGDKEGALMDCLERGVQAELQADRIDASRRQS